jgi:hypothetical protein
MSIKRLNPIVFSPSDSDRIQLSYMNDIRAEIFSQHPWKKLREAIRDDTGCDDFMTGSDVFFVGELYNLSTMQGAMTGVISAADQKPIKDIQDRLVQTWKCIPQYLRMYKNFHPEIIKSKYPRIEFMSWIVTGRIPQITSTHLNLSTKLSPDVVFSLDTRVVMKRSQCTSEDLIFGNLTSIYRSRLNYAITVLQSNLWNDIDIDGIIKDIKNNDSGRYYNISTDSLVNAPTVKRITNVNNTHRVVANASDTQLFNHIIDLLDDFILTPIASNPSPVTQDFPRKSRSKFTPYKCESSSSDSEPTLDDSSDESSSETPVKPVFSFSKTTRNQQKDSSSRKPPTKRKNIPTKVRQMTWRKYVGNSMDGKCWCCDGAITFESWHAGHIIPASKGGPDTVDNLRPLCQSCNLSMSNRPMCEFISTHNMKGRGAYEFAGDEEDVADIIDQMTSLNV